MTAVEAGPLWGARPVEDPIDDAYADLVDGLRIVHLVVDNLAFEVAAEPGMEAAEVLRRITAVLPAVPEPTKETPR